MTYTEQENENALLELINMLVFYTYHSLQYGLRPHAVASIASEFIDREKKCGMLLLMLYY